jgi:hypothetical protein
MERIAKFGWWLLPAVFFLAVTACSEEKADEKGAVEKMTDSAAEKATEYIQEPIDRAKAVQDLAQRKADEVNKAAKEALEE